MVATLRGDELLQLSEEGRCGEGPDSYPLKGCGALSKCMPALQCRVSGPSDIPESLLRGDKAARGGCAQQWHLAPTHSLKTFLNYRSNMLLVINLIHTEKPSLK